jgi:hypothetical protein
LRECFHGLKGIPEKSPMRHCEERILATKQSVVVLWLTDCFSCRKGRERNNGRISTLVNQNFSQFSHFPFLDPCLRRNAFVVSRAFLKKVSFVIARSAFQRRSNLFFNVGIASPAERGGIAMTAGFQL